MWKTAVMYTGAPVKKHTRYLTYDFSAISAWILMQQQPAETLLEDFSNDIKYTFIALIHPIQLTIAYPVGADRPAKRQKKTSCVFTGRPVPSTSALARWRVVLPSCLDSVTSNTSCLLLANVEGNVDMLWLILTLILTAHDAGTRERVRNLVFKIHKRLTARYVIASRLINASN